MLIWFTWDIVKKIISLNYKDIESFQLFYMYKKMFKNGD